jgi:hypothetical protein
MPVGQIVHKPHFGASAPETPTYSLLAGDVILVKDGEITITTPLGRVVRIPCSKIKVLVKP